jgi:hypothetical protein
MEDAFRFADDLGPFKIIQIYRPSVGLKAVSRSTISLAGRQSAGFGWRPMSAPRKPSDWREQ